MGPLGPPLPSPPTHSHTHTDLECHQLRRLPLLRLPQVSFLRRTQHALLHTQAPVKAAAQRLLLLLLLLLPAGAGGGGEGMWV